MKIHNGHIQFWLTNKGPKMFRGVKTGIYFNFHSLIETGHPKVNLKTQNAVALITSARRSFGRNLQEWPQYKNLSTYLAHLTLDKQDKKRAALAKKWLAKIENARD